MARSMLGEEIEPLVDVEPSAPVDRHAHLVKRPFAAAKTVQDADALPVLCVHSLSNLTARHHPCRNHVLRPRPGERASPPNGLQQIEVALPFWYWSAPAGPLQALLRAL